MANKTMDMDRPSPSLPFDNTYARLPDRFYQRLDPTPVTAPNLIRLNVPLAGQLGLDPDWLSSPGGVAMLAGNAVAPGSMPIALAYAGHQFGNFVPQLGDGRAILLGEMVGRDGARRDIQLKGSGPTRFSRQGDGRAALGPVLREYIVSEFMAAVDIPTTRSLAAVATGETVWRETGLPGAVLARVASSHVRIGTFQYFAARRDVEGVRDLADYVIARHYPHLAGRPNPYRGLLDEVAARQANLVAHWLLIGFIHGVMNTDNMSIAGETIDYGPCAFMDSYHPGTVFSSIDQDGRYAFGNQPRMAQWNLARLAETLLPLLGETDEAALQQAQEGIDSFVPIFQAAYGNGLCRKIGLSDAPANLDIAQQLLEAMAANEADYTLTFRRLSDAVENPGADVAVRALFTEPTAYDAWSLKWREQLAQDGTVSAERATAMRAANPLFIPRNHRIEQVISAALDGNFAPFQTLLAVLARPFDDQPEFANYANPPLPEEIVQQTFCGT